MKKILPVIIIGILVFSTFGAVAINHNVGKIELELIGPINPIIERAFTHTVIGEFGTATWCGYCPYAHGALKQIYSEDYPFYYITMVGDKNKNAYERIKDDYNLYGYPTLWFDGGYKVNVGAGSVEGAYAAYNSSINACGSRSVNDIDITLDVEWQGPKNPSPSDGKTDVPIEKCLTWTNSEMEISVSIDNNEASTYSGTLRVFVNEIESNMGWDDLYGNPYTFPFLDYAYNEDISINAGQTWSDSTFWDGMDYNDGYGNDFRNITQENTMIVAAVYDDEWHQGYSYPPSGYPFDAYYVDEAEGFYAGTNTDPKTFDVYFGTSNPPPKVVSNQSDLEYCPNDLEFDTTYYWQIIVWDDQGYSQAGPIWSFTTRGNSPPDSPSNPNPEDGETQVPINTCISWLCDDPNGDDVTFDVYFGDSNPPPLVSNNQSSKTYCPEDVLGFDTLYYWKIDAWDIYGENTVGGTWYFRTEANYPPYTPSNPNPPDGATDVSIYQILTWTGGDPNQGDKIKYDVYFGTSSPPPLVAENLLQSAYDPGEMDVDTLYYWQIESEDIEGKTTLGPLWYFTTEEEHNEPPSSPDIDGPSRGRAKEEICWTFHSEDPNNHYIRYHIDWGDGNSELTLYYPSCTPKEICHTYDSRGTYLIKATAEDEKGLFSAETVFEFIVPRNRAIQNTFLLRFFEKILNENFILKYILGLYLL